MFAFLHFLLDSLTETMLRKFKGRKKVGSAVLKKIVIIWRPKNSRISLLGNISEESWFLNAAKNVHMDWKFQRTMKSSIPFSLKHFFFIAMTPSTQFASAPLIQCKFCSFYSGKKLLYTILNVKYQKRWINFSENITI